MKPKWIIHTLLLCLLALPLISEGVGRWRRPANENAMGEKYLMPVVELYKSKGIEPALNLLKKNAQKVEKEYPNYYAFYQIIWAEAQACSGKEDENWGCALYEFLLHRTEKRYPKQVENIAGNDYILFGNIMGCYISLGKLAKAREYALRLEKHLRTKRNMDTTCESYPDSGPIFSFLPDARKRAFPYFRRDLFPTDKKSTAPIYYPYIYGLNYIADVALDSGDWIRAAELSQWFIQYTDQYLHGKNRRPFEVVRESFSAVNRQAEIAIMHEYPEDAIRIYQEFLKKAEGYYHAPKDVIAKAKLRMCVLEVSQGQPPKDAEKIADHGCALLKKNFWYGDQLQILCVNLDRAKILYGIGEKERAWKIIHTFLHKYQCEKKSYFTILTLNTAIDFALEDEVMPPQLETWLIRVLNHRRKMGSKFLELPLYEKYARFLVRCGRYQEALLIQREAVRLSSAMSLEKRLAKNQTEMTAIQKRIAQKKPTITPLKNSPIPLADVSEEPPKTPPIQIVQKSTPTATTGGTVMQSSCGQEIDLQPTESLTASLKDEMATGQIYIINPSSTDQTGELQLCGSIRSPQWQNKNWLTLTASPEFSITTNRQPLTLAAGESCVIEISAQPSKGGETNDVRCVWIPQNQSGKSKTAQWNYCSDTTGKRTAIIDAHELQANPFYLIPIHHTIQRTDENAIQTVNFSITASSNMRIESYNAQTGELIAIDANGNGSFSDQGDLISSDKNLDNYPDITFKKGEKALTILFYVKPSAFKQNQTLTIKRKTNTGWTIDAIDTLKAPAPQK